MSLSTVKDSGRKLSPHSDVRERDTGEGDIMQSKPTEETKTEDWSMGHEDSSASWEVGKFEGRNKVDVMGISEVRWQQSGELMRDEFRMFYSSDDAKGNHGVGIVLEPCASDKVISVHYVDNRVMVVRLQGKKVDLVQIYMPHSGVADEEVEETYDKIEEIVEKEKKGACVILMGD